MKKFFFSTLCMLLFVTAKGQQPSEFSELSGLFRTISFSAMPISDGYIYVFNRTIPGPLSQTTFYKIDKSGQIVNTVDLEPGSTHWGELFLSDGRIFYNGLRIINPARRILIEFDSDLTILKELVWSNILPDSPVTVVVSTTTEGAMLFNRGAHKVSGDTLYSLFPYAKVLSGGFLPITQYEILGLEGQVYTLRDMKDIEELYLLRQSAMGKNHFYIFGHVKGPILPHGVGSGNSGLIGLYDSQTGEIIGTTWYQDPFLGNLSDGGVGQVFGDKIYCSSYTVQNLGSGTPYFGTGCPGETPIIEVREASTLKFLTGRSLPECGFITNGGKPFAVNASGEIFYANRNRDNQMTYIYKFDSMFNVLWLKTYQMGWPYSIFLDNDDQLIVNGLVSNETPLPTVRIFRLDQNGDIVSATTLPVELDLQIGFLPNPFTERLYHPLLTEATVLVQLHDLSGRLRKSEIVQDGMLYTPDLPEGMYILTVRSPADGRLLHTQKVIKRQ